MATTRPGVQKPHCTAPASTNASCTRCRRSPSASPSTVVTSWPSACAASTRQAQTSVPSSSTEHEPHSPCSHAFFEPGIAELLAQREEQRLALPAVGLGLDAVDAQRDPHAERPARARARSARAERDGDSRPLPRTSSIGEAASATCSGNDAASARGAVTSTGPRRRRAERRSQLVAGARRKRDDGDHHRVSRPDLHERLRRAATGVTQTAVISSSGVERVPLHAGDELARAAARARLAPTRTRPRRPRRAAAAARRRQARTCRGCRRSCRGFGSAASRPCATPRRAPAAAPASSPCIASA